VVQGRCKLGQASLWTAVLGLIAFVAVGGPCFVSIAYAVLMDISARPFALTFYGFFGVVEAIALACGIGAYDTRAGRAGVAIALLTLLPVGYLLCVFSH
jgi:hypothetical protein